MLQGLVDTKKEYIEHLQDLLAVPIAEKIYSIYIECQKKGLKAFQTELNSIPKWNNHIIEQETEKIIERTQCDYLQKLIKVTITVSTKIKFYEYNKKLKNIKLAIPNIKDFIHKCLINAALFAWKNSYLFVQSNLRPVEIQNNLNIIEYNIRKIIAKTIVECINVKQILEYLDEVMEKSMKKKKKSAGNIKKTVYESSSVSSDESEKDDERNQLVSSVVSEMNVQSEEAEEAEEAEESSRELSEEFEGSVTSKDSNENKEEALENDNVQQDSEDAEDEEESDNNEGSEWTDKEENVEDDKEENFEDELQPDNDESNTENKANVIEASNGFKSDSESMSDSESDEIDSISSDDDANIQESPSSDIKIVSIVDAVKSQKKKPAFF